MVNRAKGFYPALVEEVVPKPISAAATHRNPATAGGGGRLDPRSEDHSAIVERRGPRDQIPIARRTCPRCLRRKLCFHLAGGRSDVCSSTSWTRRSRNSSAILSARAPADPNWRWTPNRSSGSSRRRTPGSRICRTAQRPVVLTDSDIRRFVFRLLSFHLPEISVISYDQLTPQISVQPLGVIAFPETRNGRAELRLQSSIN